MAVLDLFPGLDPMRPPREPHEPGPEARDGTTLYAYTAEECVALASTGKAVLVRGPDVPGGKAWIPYACLEPDSEVRFRGDRGSVLITHDFAAQNGWLDFLRETP